MEKLRRYKLSSFVIIFQRQAFMISKIENNKSEIAKNILLILFISNNKDFKEESLIIKKNKLVLNMKPINNLKMKKNLISFFTFDLVGKINFAFKKLFRFWFIDWDWSPSCDHRFTPLLSFY